MRGIISFIPVRYPTNFDLEHTGYLFLTDRNVDWNPQTDKRQDQLLWEMWTTRLMILIIST